MKSLLSSQDDRPKRLGGKKLFRRLKRRIAVREQVRQSVQASWSVNMQVLTEAIDRVNSALSQHGKPLYLIAEQKSDSDRVYKGKIGYTRKPFPFDDGDMQRILMVFENNGDINFKLGTKSSFPRKSITLKISEADIDAYTNVLIEFIDMNTP
ncbi:hypothetical protein [Methylobacterium sp. WL116]|uniref:hypothetical protein n=1 Tax=Methylobacterium sp. WL116 TaxID=2603889 RepID=UPI0011C90364|nr:hypothetical protein [Methylobacterium sp. WL116]TXM93934.1 hypothetical protein FV223_06585 [Methylobacterium sp. WL116]